MIKFKDYKHMTPIQVRFADIDRLNHVNNACYLTYCEVARVGYFREVLKDAVNWESNGFILARSEVDYLAPIFLYDEVYCFTKVSYMGTKSISVLNEILKKQDGKWTECATVTGVLVAMDYRNNCSIEIPSAWRELISKYES
ncbi:MAG TPA: thioesterase family protein [Bacteroidia bacterium]|nr:thioesterase family protein [Bacteroidia bacterium]